VKRLAIFVLAVLLVGCASAGNQVLKNESEESITQKLQEGVTTIEEVRAIFGAPADTSYTDGGMMIWKYQLDDVSADAINFIPVVNLFGSSYSGTRKTLTILFDRNDVVSRVNLTESDVQTRSGLLK